MGRCGSMLKSQVFVRKRCRSCAFTGFRMRNTPCGRQISQRLDVSTRLRCDNKKLGYLEEEQSARIKQ